LRQNPLIHEIRERRDFILLDPRGIGYSEPRFCPEEERVFATARLWSLSRDEELDLLAETANRCREAMTEVGTDLSAYNSLAMALDLDDVRQALGYRQWNLLAASYGTRVALTALREVPETIRTVILDGPVPPNLSWWSAQIASFGRALELLFDRCSADAACDARFPRLDQTLWSTLDALKQEPLVVPIPESVDLPEERLAIDDELLRSGIHTALYQERLIGFLPLIIEQVGARNGAVVGQLADQFGADPEQYNEALTNTVLCYEEFPFLRMDLVEQAETRYPHLADWIALDRRRAICDGLQPHRAGVEANSAVRSSVPALLITGELDPVTPISNAQLAAETLEHAFLVEIPNRSHGNASSTECTRGIVLTFLARPQDPPDTSCVSGSPPLNFVTDMR
jgi:pimeloyl-ACP methyl ester carboxylesterase